MIEDSDNDAGQAIYVEDGYWMGVQRYLDSIGAYGIHIDTTGLWGAGDFTAAGMAHLLELIRSKSILTPADCDYVLNLMSHVIATQQTGVAQTAPAGAQWAMKIGEGNFDDNSTWVVDSVGIIWYNTHSYDIAVFTRHQPTFENGEAIVNTTCGEVVQALLGVAPG
jgi:hypothetical protein